VLVPQLLPSAVPLQVTFRHWQEDIAGYQPDGEGQVIVSNVNQLTSWARPMPDAAIGGNFEHSFVTWFTATASHLRWWVQRCPASEWR